MDTYKKWKTNYGEQNINIRLDCNRCGTIKTNALFVYKILSSEINKKDGQPRDQEIFHLIKCDTCDAFTIVYHYKEGIVNKQTTDGVVKFSYGYKPDKIVTVPFSSENPDIPVAFKKDYNLMFMCFQIGSTQGVSVHCRRILDSIFLDFEKKYLDPKITAVKVDIKKRAQLITEKCAFFIEINKVIKHLKGTVSTIIHVIDEDLLITADLYIDETSFNELVEILSLIIKVHNHVFNTLNSLEKKYVKAKAIKNK